MATIDKFTLHKLRDGVYNLTSKGTGKPIPHLIAKEHDYASLARKEAKILEKLSHVNGIPQLIDRIGRFIIMTKFEGDDLFEIVVNRRLPEWEARLIIRQILHILQEIHYEGIVHCDLKPENIMYDPITKIVGIIDFDQNTTDEYTPPEALKGSCPEATPECDMWGVGIICYIIIEQLAPFKNKNHIKNRHFNTIRSKVSKNCKNFITACLKKDPSARLSLDDALEHPWLK